MASKTDGAIIILHCLSAKEGQESFKINGPVDPSCQRSRVPPAFVRKAYQRAIKKLRAETEVEGFRKGKKVPDAVVINAAGGPKYSNGACVEIILNEVVPVALQRYKDTIITESEHIEEDLDTLISALDLDSAFTFHIGLDVQPSHSWKASYRDIEVEVASLGDAEEDNATVEAKILQLRKNKGTMKLVAGRPLQTGDVAIVDFNTVRTDTGEAIQGSERKGMQLDTGLGDRAIGLVGVVEGMVGMNVGEERSITTEVGDTWWEPDALRGVKVRADIKLNELFEWDLPELTDDLVEASFPGVGSVESLRAALIDSTAAQREEDQKEAVHEALILAVAERVDADIPESAIRQLAENEYQAKLHEIQLKEKLNFEQVNQLATPQMLQNYIDSRREKLLMLQKATLGIADIFEQEGLQLSEQDVRKEMDDAARDFQENDQEYDEGRLREQVEEVLKAQKVLDWLEENTRVVLK
ncbi:g7499 [Coccomyxa elongata]